MRPSEEDLIDAYGIIRWSDEEEPGQDGWEHISLSTNNSTYS